MVGEGLHSTENEARVSDAQQGIDDRVALQEPLGSVGTGPSTMSRSLENPAF